VGLAANKAKHLTVFPLLGLCAGRYASATPTNYKAAAVGGVKLNPMNQVSKNILVLGAILLSTVVAWTYYEISKGYAMLEMAKDPQLSISRGTETAKGDYLSGHAHFQGMGLPRSRVYPGVLREEIESEYQDYVRDGAWCGYGFHVDDFGHKLGLYEYNEYYILSYNLELLKLLKRE